MLLSNSIGSRTALSMVTLFTVFATQMAQAEMIPLDSDRVAIEAKEHTFEEYRGHKALSLSNGEAIVESIEFENGVIEFDFAAPYTRGFSGVNFRKGSGDAANTAEQFYIRHHQGGKPDANQYTPVFKGLTGWQLYHGDQFSTSRDFDEGVWQHVKVVVKGDRADIYIDDMEKVELAVDLKGTIKTGRVSLFSSFAPARFANLSISSEPNPELKGTPAAKPETPPTRVTTWRVSSPMALEALEGATSLGEVDLSDLTWSTLEAEERGITNLARITQIAKGAQTVLAEVTLRSDSERLVPITFGYSDAVQVFLNGDLLYQGTNGYMTRDYRYLGTIGLFDGVPLRLKEGDNRLTFAVSESFGGWGIMADVPKTEGLAVVAAAD